MDTEKLMDDIWLSAEELLGDPTLPTTTAGIHYRAKSENWRARKRDGVRGGKALEYRLSSISPITRASILRSMNPTAQDDITLEKSDCSLKNSEKKMMPNDQNEELILKLYRSLPTDDVRARFFIRVLRLTSELLDDTVHNDGQEILQQGHSSESTNPAPHVSTHSKKAG